MWLRDYRVDGLRLDAVHAIPDKDFLRDLATRARHAAEGRQLHLVLENEHNEASLLRRSTEANNDGFDAQWNDDLHHCLHVLLTGEDEGYYADFAHDPIGRLCRCLSQGFAFQGETDYRGIARGEPSGALPSQAFVAFTQNHDQVGNRAFGERLSSLAHTDALRAATALVLLSADDPAAVHGRGMGRAAALPVLHRPPGRTGRRGPRGATRGVRTRSAASPRPVPRPGFPPDPNDEETFDALASRTRAIATRPGAASTGNCWKSAMNAGWCHNCPAAARWRRSHWAGAP